MQIRCTSCTRTIQLAATGLLPAACPHCSGPAVPTQLGPFVPERLVATGGMGEVYLARHHELGTEVALKVLPAMPLDAATTVRERFAREARLTAQIAHPGVVRVLDCDVAGDRPYLVLEFVDGESLRHRLANGPLPVADAARIAAAVADVLAAAHREGVLHRDIKPDNIMLTKTGDVRVLDFGIARAMSDDAPLTRTGEILGTPEYMAPEQLLEGPEGCDERTDVHALGILLYELATAHSPFRGSNLFQALKLVESLVPSPPSAHVAAVPPALDEVVRRALQKQPEDRFATAAEFAAAVRQAVPAARLPKEPSTSRRRWWLSLTAVLVVGCATILLLAQCAMPALLAAFGLRTAAHDLHAEVHSVATGIAVQKLLADGQWSQALVTAERAFAAGDDRMRATAQEAFVLTHVAWPLAAGAPLWLGACDERQRQRLFGDRLEPEQPPDPITQAQCALLDGNPEQALAALAAAAPSLTTRRLQLLAHCAAGSPEAQAVSAVSLPLRGDEALLALLAGRRRPVELTFWAQRLPLEAPEHWLAVNIDRHCRGDADGAKQAAEMAWLAGAGELAVLLDAAGATLAPDDGPVHLPAADGLRSLHRRVAAADVGDSPASDLLGLLLDAVATPSRDLELDRARRLPASMHNAAAHWFVHVAGATPNARDQLLLLATALGATPDYAASPWQQVAPINRPHLDAEAARAR